MTETRNLARPVTIFVTAAILLSGVGSLASPARAGTIHDVVQTFENAPAVVSVDEIEAVEEAVNGEIEQHSDLDFGNVESDQLSCFGDRYTYYSTRKYGHSSNPYTTLWAGSTTQAGCPNSDVRTAYLTVYRRYFQSTSSYSLIAGRSCRGNGDQGGCSAEYYEFKTCTPYVRYCNDYRSYHYVRNSKGSITYGTYVRTYDV